MPAARLPVAPMGRRLRLRRPDEQTADRMPPVERIKQTADLITVPNVTALKLGKGHVAAVDMVEDRGDLHGGGEPCLKRGELGQGSILDTFDLIDVGAGG